MAVSLLSHVVSDLCIGKPGVRSLPPSASIADAIAALRAGADPFVFVDVEHSRNKKIATASVKVGVADVLCYFCGDKDNPSDPAAALSRSVSVIAAAVGDRGVARLVDPQTSLLEAIDILLTENSQNLLVPLYARARKKHHHVSSSAAADYCVFTQEDIVRHLFNSISVFSPIAAQTVASLGLVRHDVATVHVDDHALTAIALLQRALIDGTAVAVVADGNALVDEISPAVLGSCGVETAAAAFAAFSAGDVMTYIDYYSMPPPEFLLRSIRARLQDMGLDAMAKLMDAPCMGGKGSLPLSPTSSSPDDDSAHGRARLPRRPSSGSYRCPSAEDVAACHPGSSLVAVMAQALACRIGYVWVVDEVSGALVGVVSFADVLGVLREQLRPSSIAGEE